jgi:hypothetical protein
MRGRRRLPGAGLQLLWFLRLILVLVLVVPLGWGLGLDQGLDQGLVLLLLVHSRSREHPRARFRVRLRALLVPSLRGVRTRVVRVVRGVVVPQCRCCQEAPVPVLQGRRGRPLFLEAVGS